MRSDVMKYMRVLEKAKDGECVRGLFHTQNLIYITKEGERVDEIGDARERV